MTPEDTQLEGRLRTSLELGSRALAVSVAHRAAMRVAPLDWCETHPVADAEVSALRSLRLLLISCVACHVERQAIKQATVMAMGGTDFAAAKAARAAWTAMLACDTAPAIAPGTAVQAVSLAAEALGAGPTIQARHDGSVSHDGRSTYGSDLSKRELIWSLARRDVGTSSGQDTGTSLWGRRLWFDDRGPLADLWTGIRDAWSAAGAGWQFWIDWYEAALDGTPLLGDWDRHWDLLTEIILTAGIDWNAPPERVNGRIAGIYGKKSADSGSARGQAATLGNVETIEALTEYGEIIEANPATGRLRSIPKTEISDYNFQDVLDRLDDAVVNFDAQDTPNSPYAIVSRDVERLRRVLDNRRDRPVRVFQVTLEVVHLIEGRAKSGECPDLANDPFLKGFCRELYGSAASLQAHDPVVQSFNNPVLQKRVEEITQAQALELAQPVALIADAAEGVLAEDSVDDAQVLADPDVGVDEKRSVLVRSVSRVVHVFGFIVRSNVAQAVGLASAILSLEQPMAQVVRWLMTLLQ